MEFMAQTGGSTGLLVVASQQPSSTRAITFYVRLAAHVARRVVTASLPDVIVTHRKTSPKANIIQLVRYG